MPLWIYLDFPYLQLDTLFADQSDQPVVIVEGQACQIIQANRSALEQGIQSGMGLGSASALCADLQVHPYQRAVEESRLNEIAQWLYLVTSDIVLFPPQGILLRATTMLTLYQGLEHYWQALSQHLAPRYIRYRYATGFSPLSAMLLAKSAANLVSADKTQLMAALHSFPVSATELNDKQVEAFRRIGITTLKQLVSLPMAEVARRFDIDVVNYVGRLLGQFKHPLDFYYPPEHFSTDLELLYEIDNSQWLTKPVAILLKRLEQFLVMRNQVAYELEVGLVQRHRQDSDEVTEKVLITSAAGEYRGDRWLALAELTFESLRLTAAVQHIQLNVIRAGEQQSNCSDLFCGIQGALQPLELISVLQAKLGPQAVSKLAMSNDPRPEHASYRQDPADPVTSSVRPARLRPSLLLPEPEPLTDKVTLIHGPERFVTGWWDGQPITRDYYIAHCHRGRWLWVFRDRNKRWFLHGQFS